MLKRIAALFLSAVLLVGCGTKEETEKSNGAATDTATSTQSTTEEAKTEEVKEEPVVTTEMTLVFADGDAKAKESIYAIVDGFNASQEAYKITIEPGVGGAYDEFLKTKDSVGEFPDIVEMRDTAVYVRAGMLEPLSPEIQSLFTSTTEFEGDVYTAPMAGEGTQGIIYNKKYFQENGINEEPKTWEEFIEICQQIKDLGDMSPVVVGGSDIWHMGFWFNKVYTDQVMQANDAFITDLYAGKTSWVAEPTTAETFKDLQELFGFVDEGWLSTPDAMVTTFLVSDMAAMLYSGPWMFTQIAEADPNFEMGWFPVPDRNGKFNLVGGAGKGGWSLSKEAAADENKKAGFEAFVQYFFSSEVYGAFLEAMSGFPTTVTKPEMTVSPILQEVIDTAAGADSLSKMWNGKVGSDELPPDFRNYTYKVLVEVLAGAKSIEDALAELDTTWAASTQDFNPVTGAGF